MKASNLVALAARTVVTGAAGAAAFDVIRRTTRAVPKRELAVRGTTWGLRGVRSAERGAESARLRTADIVAEAKGRIGEQASPPGPASAGHEHAH